MHGYLGWDVGAWHCQKGKSRDALVLMTDDGTNVTTVGRPRRGNLRENYNASGTALELLESMLSFTGSSCSAWSDVTMAIDTPLGWPEAFRQVIDGGDVGRIGDSKAENSILFRATERWLWEQGYSPLSAVQDLIGSQVTKGLAFLSRLGLRMTTTGVWEGTVNGIRVTAIETYPAPCRYSDGLQTLKAEDTAWTDGDTGDKADARVCALVASMFASDKLRPFGQRVLAPPINGAPPREGWIWVPQDCLPNPKAPR
jgi:hypothetical protein